MNTMTFTAEVSSAVAPTTNAGANQEQERIEEIRKTLRRQQETTSKLFDVRLSLRFLAKVTEQAGYKDDASLDADHIYGLGQVLQMLYDKMVNADESIPPAFTLERLFGVELEGKDE